jgi:hypothetical protein
MSQNDVVKNYSGPPQRLTAVFLPQLLADEAADRV